ncbi:MAG: hypothetical protein PVG39_28240 [Desulfobacteraceae bacterium]|jgi:hypothetical protein
MTIECKFEQRFDPEKCLQYVNDESSVLHCHHYATLFTKLAMDTKYLGGPKLLSESMEEAAYLTLSKYFIVENVSSVDDRRAIAEQYFALAGLGLLSISLSSDGGRAVMKHSHVDEGWIKKWKKEKYSVNFIGQGYIAAAFSAINDKSIGTYRINEVRSIVKGESVSEFEVTIK